MNLGPPFTGSLPPVPDPSPVLGTLLLQHGIRGAAAKTRPTRSLVILLVRSAVIATQHYLKAARLIDEIRIGATEVIPLSLSDDLEISVIFARRALDALARLKAKTDGPLLDRQTRRGIEAQLPDQIRIRDAIVHAAEHCASGILPDGRPVSVSVSSDAATILVGDTSLLSSSYAQFLTSLMAISETAAAWDEPPSPQPKCT